MFDVGLCNLLPNECLHPILNSLPLEDLLHAGQVCRRWYCNAEFILSRKQTLILHIAGSALEARGVAKYMHYCSKQSSAQPAKNVLMCYKAKQVMANVARSGRLVTRMSSLTYLMVGTFNFEGWANQLNHVIDCLPQLVTLKLVTFKSTFYEMHWERLFIKLNRLQGLKHLTILSRCPASFEISRNFRFIFDENTLFLARLEEFYLGGIHDQDASKILAKLGANLRRLGFYYENNTTSLAQLNLIPDEAKQALTHLSIFAFANRKMTQLEFDRFAPHLPSLEYISTTL